MVLLFIRYLQFFFNLALILLFLYLVVQFIITVQRDVQERISEYSMGKSAPLRDRETNSTERILRIRYRTGDCHVRDAVQNQLRYPYGSCHVAPMRSLGIVYEP